jgi:hypothetical protein
MYTIVNKITGRLVNGVIMIALCSTAFAPLSAEAAVSSWQKGASIWPSSQTDFSSSAFQQVVTHLKTLGVNYVTLIIPYYQSNTGSTDIQRGYNTPTDASLISGIQYAHSQGMKVMLKPQLDSYDGQWRANINPGDRNTWYTNYTNMLMTYANIATQQGVEELCVGAELVDMSAATQNSDNTARWQSIIGQVRAVYGGQLTYSANWGGDPFGDEVDHIQFWNSLDSIGISAYYNLDTDGSVSSLEGVWDNWKNSTILPLSQKWNKPVLFTEIGYKSVTGAHYQPWNSGLSGSYDGTEQSNDYQALFEYWNNQSFMQGVHLWYILPNSGAGGTGNIDYTPQNKPAEGVISQWFTAASTGGSSGGGAVSSGTVSAKGSADPSSVNAGQTVSLSAAISDSGGSVVNANVDFEVYSGSSRVFQKVFTGQTIGSQTLQLSTGWTPSTSGTYTFKIGVFSTNWSQLYTWNNSAAQISVGAQSSSGGGSVSVGSNVIDIWWPSDGSSVSGMQPFKALLENTDLSQYNMYWQVDGGGLVQMSDSQDGYPHKEALVDLSGWHWKGNGPYTVNFVAKDAAGNTLSQKSVNIEVF